MSEPVEDVRPYLLTEKGEPLLDCDGDPYLDAIVDVWGHSLCTICVYDALPVPPYSSGTGHDHQPLHVQAWCPDPKPPRVHWYTRVLTPKERRRAHEYLRHPGCTPERHAWYEKQKYDEALAERDAAERKLGETGAKKPGWSIQ